MSNKVLDVGCGSSKFPGSIGMDLLPLEGVDIVYDINSVPWPFVDGEFDRIIFKHSISHVQNIVPIMEEVHRVCRDGAVVEIIAPHFSSDNSFTDPTHTLSMGYRSMNYFCDNIDNWKYKYIASSFSLESSYISFGEFDVDFNAKEYEQRLNLHRYIGIEFIVNKCKRIYEKFFAFIVPANEVYFRLKVEKC